MNETEKLVDLYCSRLQGIRQAQARYFTLLFVALGLIWAFYWGKPGASPVTVLGTPIADKVLLGIVPGLSTIFWLGWVGSLCAATPGFASLQEAWKNAGARAELSLEATEVYQSWPDGLKFIWAPSAAVFFQAILALAVLASTFAVGLLITPKLKGYSAFLFAGYCLFCLGWQAAATWKWVSPKIGTSR